MDWNKLAQVGGFAGLVAGLATPVGAAVWQLSGQLSSLSVQGQANEKSIEELGRDIKDLDRKVNNLYLAMASAGKLDPCLEDKTKPDGAERTSCV